MSGHCIPYPYPSLPVAQPATPACAQQPASSAAQCFWLRPHLQISASDSFEIAFNAACGLIEAGQLRAAEEQLRLAARVGE